ncbi:MAG TPA: hypothetical protein PLJ62_12170 [Thermoflexales bacterium]|nr:hypothetical protein [Thermoflexales bacterium]HQX74838.1 hypothetical protein [Thermoflexales bacterium]HQZ21875.1 hypothetical protein [Thermoflexales bacterium]HRA00950.1 hypothetical protein [Thermoflexales bacterium]
MFKTQPLSQRDPRWADVPLGFNTQGSTIGLHGCLLTDVAMVANGNGFSETPSTLNEKLKALGPDIGYTGDTKNLLVWTGVEGALKDLKFSDYDACANGAPIERINAQLQAGVPAIVKLDFSPVPGMQEHWVVLYEQRGNDYGIYDPWPKPGQGNDRSLLTEYGFAGDAQNIIRTVVWLTGHAGTAPARLVVRAVDEWRRGGLRMRQTASLDGAVIKTLPKGAELLVLGDFDTAIKKINVEGQWLYARDIEGDEGFVPAWFVVQRIWNPQLNPSINKLSVLSAANPQTKKTKKKTKKAAKKLAQKLAKKKAKK